MKAKLLLILSGMVVLAGCATGLSSERYLCNTREFMLSQGKPVSYVEGYLDGCSSGRRTAGDKKYTYRRDNTQADIDALYAQGWQEGQICCRNEALAEQQRAEQDKLASRGTIFTSVDEQRRQRMEAESRAADAEVREIWEELKK